MIAVERWAVSGGAALFAVPSARLPGLGDTGLGLMFSRALPPLPVPDLGQGPGPRPLP